MIKLKGMHDSMVRCAVSEDVDAATLAAEFRDLVSKDKGILPGCRVVLDFGGRPLSKETIGTVLSIFVWEAGVEVAAWITYDAESQQLLKRAGLPTVEPQPKPRRDGRAAPTSGLLLRRTMRSGQRVEHPGDVIIAGHVNNGAEIFASGNITVLGRLRGLVHAGYNGNDGASVIARSMEAVQIRIGGKVGSLDKNAAWWGKMVMARVEDDMVFIDYWPAVKTEVPSAAVIDS